MSAVITTHQRRGLGLAVACTIITLNNLPEFIASEQGTACHNFLNLVFQGLPPNERVAPTFNKQWLQDAKTALSFLPREQFPDIMRYNASWFMFHEVYRQMKVSELLDEHLDGLYRLGEAFVGKRTALHMPGKSHTNDQATEQAGHMLFFAAKGTGYYAEVDTFDGVTVL